MRITLITFASGYKSLMEKYAAPPSFDNMGNGKVGNGFKKGDEEGFGARKR